MEIKKELWIGSVISIVLLAMTMVYSVKYFSSRRQVNSQSVFENQTTETNQGSKSTTKSQLTGSNKTSTTSLTATEIAKHNKASDCWIVINNKVLSVSAYLNLHPGGPGTIVPYCGKDATEAFNSIKGGKGHSQQAVNMFSNLLVGLLGQSITPEVKAQLTQVPTNTGRQNETINNQEREDD